MGNYDPIAAYELWLDNENQKLKPQFHHMLDEASLDLLHSGDLTVEFIDGEPNFTLTEQGHKHAIEAKQRLANE